MVEEDSQELVRLKNGIQAKRKAMEMARTDEMKQSLSREVDDLEKRALQLSTPETYNKLVDLINSEMATNLPMFGRTAEGGGAARLTKPQAETMPKKGIVFSEDMKRRVKEKMLEKQPPQMKKAEPSTYKHGGVVENTGWAKVHKGEQVLTKGQAISMQRHAGHGMIA